MIGESFRTGGKLDGTKLTTFASFCILVISWAADQFFSTKVNESVFFTFSGIVVSGLGIGAYTYKNKQKEDAQTPSQ